MERKLSFEQACAEYVHRYTMEHVPAWARVHDDIMPGYYAPQFRSDREWYDATRFYGEEGHVGRRSDCYTSGQTWPLGKWLERPYTR